jgi:RimJ/RimL family protein N-acetyltransferase|tara:strand:+ start:1864 stop:2487 length:624 start_codon:yes stop_codon:yes gene_type:complete
MLLKLEKATKKHIKFLWNLRNDKNVRRQSLDNKKIKLTTHQKWFERSQKNNFLKIYIFYLSKDEYVGYVRFALKNSYAETSIALLEKYRGQHLSKNMLLLAEKKVNKNKFTAKVNCNNKKSISLFKSLDYYIVSKKNNFYYMKKKNLKINYLKYIKQIENIRKKNNTNWMDILRIAFENDPRKTALTMSKVYHQDKKISQIAKKLSK